MNFAAALDELNDAALADFGQSVTLTLAGNNGGTYTLAGIYQSAFSTARFYGVPAGEAAHELTMKTRDLDAIAAQGRAVAAGDAVTTGGKSFRISDIQPDDGDMSLLILVER